MAELTLKTAKNTYKLLENSIYDFEKNTDINMSILNAVDALPYNKQTKVLKNILETSTTLCFINLDILSAYRQYLSAQTNYEERYAMKSLNTIMSEGYKKVFGFTQNSKSFWKIHMKSVVNDYPELLADYERITNSLEILALNSVFNKDMRDFSVHYDIDPRKVYSMLSQLSAEEVSDRFTSFFACITDVLVFIRKTIDIVVTPFLSTKI